MPGSKKRPIRNSKRSQGEGSRLRKILPVLLVTILCYIVCILLCAIAILYSDTSASVGYGAMVALCAAAFLSAFFAGMRSKQNGLLTGFLTTLPVHVLLLLLSLLHGGFSADLTLLFVFVILSLVSMLGGVLAVNRRDKPHKPHHRKPGRAG